MTSTEFRTIQAALQAAIAATETARVTVAELLEKLQGPGEPGKRGESQFSPRCLIDEKQAADSIRQLTDKLGANEFKILAGAKSSLESCALAAENRAAELDARLKESLTQATRTSAELSALNEALTAKINELLVVNYSTLDLLSKVAAMFEAFAAFLCKSSSSFAMVDTLRKVPTNVIGGFVIAAMLIWVIRYFCQAIHSEDQNLLVDLSRVETARGLLTLLVGAGTIFVGLMIVVGMWLGDGDAESEKKFLRSKEVFALLMTVFGTVLGFYYGSEKSALRAEEQMELAPFITSRESSNSFRLATSVSGGKPPYYFSVENLNLTNAPAEGRRIEHLFTNLDTKILTFKMVVSDGSSNHVSESGTIPALEK